MRERFLIDDEDTEEIDGFPWEILSESEELGKE